MKIQRAYIPVIVDGQHLGGGIPVDISEQCVICQNWLIGLTCKAFPKGIPNKILQAVFDHTESFPGDGGILFDPI